MNRRFLKRPVLLAAGFFWLTLGNSFSPAQSAAEVQSVQERARLSATERLMVQFIDGHNEEALDLLRRVVNVNSGTMNLKGVREVGRIFRAELDALGFATRWVDGESFDRAGHLMAIDGLGLMGSGDHTVDETADLTTLASQTKRAAVFLHRLSQDALAVR